MYCCSVWFAFVFGRVGKFDPVAEPRRRIACRGTGVLIPPTLLARANEVFDEPQAPRWAALRRQRIELIRLTLRFPSSRAAPSKCGGKNVALAGRIGKSSPGARGWFHETAAEPGCPRRYRAISERYILDASCSNFDPKLGGLQNMLPTLRTAHSITSSAVAAE